MTPVVYLADDGPIAGEVQVALKDLLAEEELAGAAR
jgi:hypothetical protein